MSAIVAGTADLGGCFPKMAGQHHLAAYDILFRKSIW